MRNFALWNTKTLIVFMENARFWHIQYYQYFITNCYAFFCLKKENSVLDLTGHHLFLKSIPFQYNRIALIHT